MANVHHQPGLGHTVIHARHLHISAGPHSLLHGVSLTVAAGERVALVGHNGAGKSTLLRALAGFGRVSGGVLQVLGTDLAAPCTPASLRQLRGRVAQVHQGLHLVGRLTALDNVLIGGAGRHPSPWTWLRRWPAAETQAAQAVLASVGLGPAAGQRTDTLSGGERQKVAIARALHQRAHLLLADEPTASLDDRAADDLVQLLASEVLASQTTLVCVLHDLDLLPRLANRVVALRQGRVVADGPVTADTPDQLRGLLR